MLRELRRRDPKIAFSARYAMAYSAMKEFARAARRDITPLHFAAGGGHTAIVEALIDKGANVNAAAKNKTRPLHWAASKGHKRVVEVLINRGADLNAGDFFGFHRSVGCGA